VTVLFLFLISKAAWNFLTVSSASPIEKNNKHIDGMETENEALEIGRAHV
jgi:hypothetical protein